MEIRNVDFSNVRDNKPIISNRDVFVMFIDKKIAIRSHFDDKEVCKDIPGNKWNGVMKMWTYPKEYQVLLEIQKRFLKVRFSDEVIAWGKNIENKRKQLIDIKNNNDIDINIENSDKLYPYQRVGVHYISKAKRFFLGDEMGLGKTFQALLGLEMSNTQKNLIIVPSITVAYTWEQEINKWVSHRKYKIVTGTPKKKEQAIREFTDGFLIIIINSAVLYIDELLKIDWNAIVIDEAHTIKNRKTTRTETIKKLNADIRIAMTGTPILNGIGEIDNKDALDTDLRKSAEELWSILNWLYPEKFRSFWRFAENHFQIHDDGRFIKLKDEVEFYAMLAPVMLRRLRKDVKPDLPPKTYIEHLVDLYPQERRILDSLQRGLMVKLSSGELIGQMDVLAEITRSRQCCISERLITRDMDGEIKSAKLDNLLEIIKENPEKKIVVFSQFKEAINLTEKFLSQKNVHSVKHTGDTSPKNRKIVLQSFINDNNVKIFLATIGSIGVGTDGLQVANICVFLDRYWNRVNAQAEDRLLRIGQKADNVIIIKILANNSIEQRIEMMNVQKDVVFDEWIEGSQNVKSDLVYLLGGNKNV